MHYPFVYRKTAESLYDALIEDAFYIAMENSVDGDHNHRREAMLRYYDYAMQEAERYGALSIPGEGPIGAAIWCKPLQHHHQARLAAEKSRFLNDFMGPASLDTYRRITGFMADRTGKQVSPDGWYLSILGLAPRFQGKGRGRHLLTPVLTQTDALRRTTYLETFTPRNMRFYGGQGFKAVADFVEPFTAARYWVMVREPQDPLTGKA